MATTATPTTHRGKPALRITCDCTTHPEGMGAAIVAGRTEFPTANIHGTVLMAHHPARPIRIGAQRRGIFAVKPLTGAAARDAAWVRTFGTGTEWLDGEASGFNPNRLEELKQAGVFAPHPTKPGTLTVQA